MSLTIEEIKKLANLSRLSFTDEELKSFSSEMDEIIAFADTINNSVAGSTEDIKSAKSSSLPCDELRADDVKESLPNEKILSNVEGENGYFAIRRVVK